MSDKKTMLIVLFVVFPVAMMANLPVKREACSGSDGVQKKVLLEVAGEIKVICQSCPKDWIAQGGLCFHLLHSSSAHSVARQKCQDLGAYLPVIKSAKENAFIFSLAKGKGRPWLGMHMKDDSKFYWDDHTPVADTFSAWNPGEPNYLKTEKCAYMYVSGGRREGKWNNIHCNAKSLVICQKHI